MLALSPGCPTLFKIAQELLKDQAGQLGSGAKVSTLFTCCWVRLNWLSSNSGLS